MILQIFLLLKKGICLPLERFADKSVKNLIESIDKARLGSSCAITCWAFD